MDDREAIIIPAYTGHDHYMSPYECYDSCGTCGGARCERCREVYEVTYYGPGSDEMHSRIFRNRDEALEAKRNWEAGN